MTVKALDECLNALLGEREWMTGLAHALVADTATAEDLAQDAWVAVLESRRSVRAPRPFLRAVMRNGLRAKARSDRRRAVREGVAATVAPTDEPSTAEVASRFEAHREVAAAVSELDEPFRTTVLQHYYDGRTLAEIARDTKTPEGTVRWRLHKAHGVLREKLAGRLGADKWRGALLPFCTLRTGKAAALSLPLFSLLVVGGVACLFAAASLLGWFARADDGGESAILAKTHSSSSEDRAQGESVAARSESTRTEKDSVSETREEEPVAGQAATIRARFLGRDDAPIGGVSLRVVGARLGSGVTTNSALVRLLPGATSGPDGRAVLPLRAGVALLEQIDSSFRRKAGEVWTLVVEARGKAHEKKRFDVHIAHGDDRDLGVIRLRSASSVRGRVVDADGKGVAGVEVALTYPPFPTDCERYANSATRPHSKRTTTTARWLGAGQFTLRGVPHGLAMVWAKAPGHRTAYAVVDVRADTKVDTLELRPLRASSIEAAPEREIAFRVTDPNGRPARRAQVWVQCDGMSSQGSTNAEGRVKLTYTSKKRTPRLLVGATDTDGRWGPVQRADVDPEKEVELRMSELRTVEILARTTSSEPLVDLHASWSATKSGLGHVWAQGKGSTLRIAAPVAPTVIEVRALGHAAHEIEVTDPTTLSNRLEVTLRPILGVRGRVVANGKPVANAEVRFLTPARRFIIRVNGFRSRFGRVGMSETDRSGRFQFDLDRPLPLRVLVYRAGFAPRLTDLFDFDPKRGTPNFEIELTKGATIEGRVLDRDRQPVARAVVALNGYLGYARTAISGRDGTYRFRDVRPGRYELRPTDKLIRGMHSISQVGGKPAKPRTNVEVVGTDAVRHDVLLDSCRLDGQLSAQGASLAGWTATLRSPHDNREIATSAVDGAGCFSLATCEAGRFKLRIDSAGGPLGTVRIETHVELRAGDNAFRHALEFGKLTGELPAKGRAFELVAERGELHMVVPVRRRSDGGFAAPLVPVGQVRLVGGKRREQLGVFVVRAAQR